MLSKEKLETLYSSVFSMMDIAKKENCSEHKIDYWMKKYEIPRRSRSEAIYIKRNPEGDPFHIKLTRNEEQNQLFCLGIGVYLGEGDKRSSCAVKVGNSNPDILKLFLRFLREICGAKESKIRAELNIFDDVNIDKAINFWLDKLGLEKHQLRTVTVREPRGDGSYRHKSEYGTFSIYFDNTKLKSIVNKWCEEALDKFR